MQTAYTNISSLSIINEETRQYLNSVDIENNENSTESISNG